MCPDLFKHVHDAQHANHPFLVLDDATLSYGELAASMHRVAGFFEAHGVSQSDRIAVCCRDDLTVTLLYLAAMRVGVTTAIIDPGSSLDEITLLVRTARARLLFTDEALGGESALEAALLAGGKVHVVGPERSRLIALLDAHPTAARLPAELPADGSAFILFTSGTTSRPKGVEVSFGAVSAHMKTMHAQYGYGPDSVVLNSLPLHHSDGINHGPVNLVAAGGTLVRMGAFAVQQLPEIFSSIGERGITHLITVPTVLALMMRTGHEHDRAFRTGRFRFVSSTAGPLDETLWRSFESRFETMIVNAYGLTETVCEGFYCGPDADTRRVGTIGKPVDLEVRLLAADGSDAGAGEIGEVVLRGDCVMKGYFDAPEATAEVLRDGWLYTGDLAVRDADGFYTLAGRKKNVIICGGINVYPEDVTRTITRMAGVLEAITLGVADDTWGERVVSCVVTEGPDAPGADAVIDHCRRHLAPEKVPSRVFEFVALPRGASGKVALPEVRRLVAERLRAERASGASGDLAAQVLAIAARSFKVSVSALSTDADAESTAGWNSLAHMDFLLALETAFDFKMEAGDLLDIITLGDAIAYVQRRVRS